MTSSSSLVLMHFCFLRVCICWAAQCLLALSVSFTHPPSAFSDRKIMSLQSTLRCSRSHHVVAILQYTIQSRDMHDGNAAIDADPLTVIGLSIISLGSLIFSVGDSMAVFMIGRCARASHPIPEYGEKPMQHTSRVAKM
jgi:hypothetical protein